MTGSGRSACGPRAPRRPAQRQRVRRSCSKLRTGWRRGRAEGKRAADAGGKVCRLTSGASLSRLLDDAYDGLAQVAAAAAAAGAGAGVCGGRGR